VISGRVAVRLALALLCAAPTSALADVTARYQVGDGKQTLTVEVDDGGSTRLALDDKFTLLHRDGVDYLILDVKDLRFVARLADATDVLKSHLANAGGAKERAMQFVLEPGTPGTVAGYATTGWTFGPKDSGEGQMLDVAVSDSKDLAPIGAVMRGAGEAILPVLSGLFPESSQFGPRLRELLGKGTLVRVGRLIELQSTDRNEIDPHHFDLPGPVTSRDELMKAMGPQAATPAPAPPLP
jgi:hypothetical protein